MRVFASSLLLLTVTIGCGTRSERAPAIGEAYAGPSILVLRQEINPRSAEAAKVPHGERLEIIGQRRRFVKVRTSKGQEGWTDERLLLSPDEVARLKRFNQQSRLMPSQGAATTYDALNIHTEPSRYAPSFVQVKQGEKFEVLAHEAAPRKAPGRKVLIAPAPKPVTIKKSAKAPKIPPPPAPAPPPPPEDWIALSKTNLPQEDEKDPEPEPMDDWSLVRTAGGQSGWVLTRRVFMAIPDEVAQYAEGRRITSYFPLGEIRDGDQVKKIWLWTTIEQSLQPYDFDSYRVFVWSLRHHRYEPNLVQIYDRKEAEPNLLGDLELFDVETESTQKVTVTERNLRQYKQIFRDFQESVRRYCTNYGLGCTRTTADVPFDDLILKMMRTAGAVQ